MKILTVPNPILREKSKTIKKIDNKTKELIKLMEKSVNLRGIGLSAVQIGEPIRLFIVRLAKEKTYTSFINPVIVQLSTELLNNVVDSKNPYEGCLSVPKYWGEVNRHKSIEISYDTIVNNEVVHKQGLFTSFSSIVIQHEYDHLEGILFIDRILQQNGILYYATGKKDEKGKEIWERVKLT